MRQNIIKLFASSWYIFLTYIYDARSHLYQIPNAVWSDFLSSAVKQHFVVPTSV